ncbi:MAG TPA: carboxypeptidase-like regulatory domain-containing protein, partial [Candidatus Hydrogenedentes bacterium]|nr:carboxypeptidase-like regulatory domain-containing protein [Candidatus Hydrogenedentota bacterium]
YFEFKHLPKSDFIVRAWSAQQLAITAVLFDETHLVWDGVLELRPAQVLGGAIVDAEGAPIADAMVFPCPVDTTSASWLSFLPETTDATGRFLFTHVPDTCKFIVNAPGYGAWVSQAIHAGTTNAVISVEPSGGVAGVLSHVQEDRPAANLPVRLEAITYPLMTRRTKTDINGEFTFANLPAGVYRVALDTDRFAFASGSPCIEMRAGAGGVARQTLEVMRAEFARGRVTDETGAGVPNVTVMARTAASSIQAKTDYAGYYQLRGLVPGQYRVAVRDAAGFAIEAVPAPVLAVQPDRDAVGPNFVLRPGAGKGRVTFHAVAADRRPLEGAAVFYVVEPVEGEDGADVLRGAALTDASGQFTLEEVPRDWRFRAYASTGVQVSALTDWASLGGRTEATVALVVSTKAAERLPEILAALHP